MAKLEIYYDGKLIRELVPSPFLNKETATNIYVNAERSFTLLQKFIAAVTRNVLEECGDDVSDLPEYKLGKVMNEAIAFSNLVDKQGNADELSEV